MVRNMRIVVWGTGYIANEYMERGCYRINDEVIAFVDNNRSLWGQKYKGIKIVSPDELQNLNFGRLIICTTYCSEVKEQIRKYTNVDGNKVITYFDLEEEIKGKLIDQYKNSPNMEIQAIIKYYKVHSLNIFGYYEGEREIKYPVKYETDGMPYIIFEGKKMFYPKKHKFSKSCDCVYVKNLLYEQGMHSPHRYIKSDNIIRKNMVIVDAGVCEGNFALRYVEDAKKIYLIESDPHWVEALNRTFQPYKDKVVICDKYLSGEDTEDTITLDSLINEKIDLLKMDIEGYETEALKGGNRILRESSAYCAICSYHKHGDEQEIRSLLQSYGYQTDTSEGYMFFPYDTCLELRKGVVYGEKY